MPRKTTAKQVKNTRIFFKFSFVLLCVAVCAAAAFFLLKKPGGKASDFSLINAYDSPAMSFASEEVGKRPVLFGENLCVVSGDSEADPSVSSEAGITFNRTTGQVVYSKNAYERLYPASVTKVMTCLVALKYGDLSSEITVTGAMLANLDPESSVCRIKDGDVINLEELLYGLMLPSGNDAANAIAYLVAGSEEAFVELMNQEARRIGATDSHFMNAHGLNHPDHYTTAYDIYLMYNELLDNETFLEIIEAQEYTAEYMNQGQPVYNTWGRGIWYFTGQAAAPEGVTPLGGKTGTTPEAKYCLSLASQDAGGNQYVSVVLRAETRDALYGSMTALLSKIVK